MRSICNAAAVGLGSLFVLASVVVATPPAFSNQATAAGVGVSHSTSGFTLTGYAGGACVGDFNNDGFQDLFYLSGGGNSHPDYLFINNGDGTFTDHAAEWGLSAIHKGKGVSCGDFNNDGWLDLYVTSAGPSGQGAQVAHYKLYRNNGDSTFTNIAASAGVATVDPGYPTGWGSTWGDFDHDGDLDLYVGGFNTSAPSNNGNRLFRNNGDETFTDITATIGLFSGVGPIANFSQRFVDMDQDRWPELLLAGDFKGAGFVGSRYLRSNGGATFSDMTVASHTGQEENGMGHTVGDFNNDGRIDWYTTSIYLPSNGWTGNKIYRNVSANNFTQYAISAGVNDGGYGWGSIAVDFNHDGLSDIAETNGDDSSGGTFFNEQSYLWINDGDDTFTEQALASGFVHFGKGRCLINFDYDNDGDQDAALCTNKGPLYLFRNDLDLSQPDTHWLRVFLNTQGIEGLAPNGVGSKVVAQVGLKSYTRSIDGGSTFLGIPELSAHFGLATATMVDTLTVQWPDGTDTVINGVATNQTITISPTPACPGDVQRDGIVDGADLGMLLGNWGGAGLGDLDGNGIVDGADLGVLLGAWGNCP